jgi:hypothetical protein
MKNKVSITGGRIEFNGFRVANLVAALPASVRSDFVDYVENSARRAYDLGRKDGYDEGFKEGSDVDEYQAAARLR